MVLVLQVPHQVTCLVVAGQLGDRRGSDYFNAANG